MGRFVQCAGIALVFNGRVFLVQPSYASHLEIPKGHLKRGEPSDIAAKREFKEETGLTCPDDISFLTTIYRELAQPQGKIKRVDVFLAFGTGNEVFSGCSPTNGGEYDGIPEITGGKYYTFNDALHLISEWQRPVIEALVDTCMSNFKQFRRFTKNA
jgi:8-oxo-dGTP pyrophosphatase MutT (NUDIX family)